MRATRLLLATIVCLFSAGCGFTGGPRLRVMSVQAQEPARVDAVVSVEDRDGAIDYLEASSFAVQENDVELDPATNPITIGPPDAITAEVIVVVDEASRASAEMRKNLREGLGHLAEKLTPHARVVLLGLSGARTLRNLGDFQRQATQDNTPVVLPPAGGDSARNLNGAVEEGLRRLSESRQIHSKYNGVLVVITLGPDSAGIVSTEQLWKNRNLDEFSLFGARPTGVEVDTLFDAARVIEFEESDVAMRLFDLGIAVRDHLNSTYLLSYCSNARAGSRAISVRVHYEGHDGSPRNAFGRAATPIDTSQFKAGCQIAEASDDSAATADASDDEASELAAEPTPAPPRVDPSPSPQEKPKPVPSKKSRPRRNAPPRDVIAPPTGDKYR